MAEYIKSLFLERNKKHANVYESIKALLFHVGYDYAQGHTGANGYLGHLIGQTRTFEADGHRDKWALGASRHQGKQVFAANEHFGA